MTLPSNAQTFANHMTDIWEGDNPLLYDRYHNALKVARYNARQLAPKLNEGGEVAYLFQFDDGSMALINEQSVQVVT